MGIMRDVVVVRGEQELFGRAAHLFAGADEVACAANDLHTWAAAMPRREIADGIERDGAAGKRIRKIYRPGVLLDSGTSKHLREIERMGASIRITPDELNETIILDRRVAILAGDMAEGVRAYSVITSPEVVPGIASLFEAAWSAATEWPSTTRGSRRSGCKYETAARTLGLGLRTYRRRVAELMATLDASSRFQAGVRARELGLI